MSPSALFWTGLLTGLALGALLTAWLTTETLRRSGQLRERGPYPVDWPHVGARRRLPPPDPKPETGTTVNRGW